MPIPFIIGAIAVAVTVYKAKNVVESIVDNTLIDAVKPEEGSIVYCDFFIGEHSGVYIGNNTIVNLNGDGKIEAVTIEKFLQGTTGVSIYVSCEDKYSTENPYVARLAKSMLGEERDYHTILNNCHQFTSGCLIGKYENPHNFLWMLKDTAEKEIDANEWRVWKDLYEQDEEKPTDIVKDANLKLERVNEKLNNSYDILNDFIKSREPLKTHFTKTHFPKLKFKKNNSPFLT